MIEMVKFNNAKDDKIPIKCNDCLSCDSKDCQDQQCQKSRGLSSKCE